MATRATWRRCPATPPPPSTAPITGRPGLDRVAALAPTVAAELFDTRANMDTGTAAGFLRRALNALNRNGADYADIASSGAIDSATLEALQAFLRTRGTAAGTVLVKALNALQGARYIALAETRPADETLLCGWLANRVA